MKGIDGGYKLSELLSGKGGQILDLQNEEGWGEKEICTKGMELGDSRGRSPVV